MSFFTADLGRHAKGGLVENWREGRKFPAALLPCLSLCSCISAVAVFPSRLQLLPRSPSLMAPAPMGPSQFQYLQETWFWPLVPPSARTVSRALVCLWLPAVANLCFSTVSC